jgi:hypothetical protein
MAAVLLWLSGLDAFDSDAEAEPPDRELGEIEQGIGAGESERMASGSPLCKQPLEGGDGRIFAFAARQQVITLAAPVVEVKPSKLRLR